MKFSIVTDMLGNESFEETLQLSKDLGFDYIDLRGKLNGDTIDTISYDKALELSKIIEKYGLQVNTLTSWAVNPCAFGGPSKYDNFDENHHSNMSKVLNRLFDLADIFSAQYVRVYPLNRKQNHHLLSATEQEREFENTANVLRNHAEHARKRNKTLLIENEPPTLANTTEDLGKLIKAINHPNAKVNWDIVNCWRVGDYATIEKYQELKGYVASTHLKGAKRAENSISSAMPNGMFGHFAIAGKDDFDHTPIMRELLTHDPNVILSIDTHYPEFKDEDKIGEVEVVKMTKEYFEQIINVRV